MSLTIEAKTPKAAHEAFLKALKEPPIYLRPTQVADAEDLRERADYLRSVLDATRALEQWILQDIASSMSGGLPSSKLDDFNAHLSDHAGDVAGLLTCAAEELESGGTW